MDRIGWDGMGWNYLKLRKYPRERSHWQSGQPRLKLKVKSIFVKIF